MNNNLPGVMLAMVMIVTAAPPSSKMKCCDFSWLNNLLSLTLLIYLFYLGGNLYQHANTAISSLAMIYFRKCVNRWLNYCFTYCISLC